MREESLQGFEELLQLALEEDLGEAGDVTSRAIFSGDDRTKAVLVSKDSGVLCGIGLFARVFTRLDAGVIVRLFHDDGAILSPGDRVASLEGPTLAILEGERTAINFIAYLSGIATQSARMAERAASAGKAVILDTRKTLPGWRSLSKYAVRVGGAKNHRMGLHDMVLIKDNHQDAAGGIGNAVRRVRERWGSAYRIEVECRSLADVSEALGLGVDVIMLDNMDAQTCREALALPRPVGSTTAFEASGNMDLERVAAYSAVGVDFISVGGLTHSVKAFDFSLRIEGGGE